MWHSAISLVDLTQVTPALAKGFVRGHCAPNIDLSFSVSNELAMLHCPQPGQDGGWDLPLVDSKVYW